jgi:glycolate oxidase iron-sulfur subunit
MLLPDHFRIPAKLPDQPVYKATGTSKGRVAVFAGCSTRYLFPHLGEALVRVLSNLGYEVILPREEQCCGVPFRTLGMEDKAVDYARRNLAVFSRLKADAVVSLCPTCIVALKKMYPELIGEGTDNIMDVASFLLRHEGRAFSKRLLMKGFYHDPCHMIYGLNITEEPRKILRECGIELVEGDQNSCCGFGGSYSIKFRNESIKFARARAEEIESSEAEAVFTSCPGCLLQLKKVVKKAGVFHIIEAIDSAV